MSGLPKRFPDREQIGAVRAEAEQLEAGQQAETKRRLAGRVLARREHGKLVFLDLVDRSGSIQLLLEVERTGPVELDLGDVIGVTGAPARTRRGEPSLAVDELVLLAKNRRPLPDVFHGVTDVETRILQPRYGGAFAEPFVTHYNALDRDYYLRIATELYLKRLIVGGLERVYELA